MFGQSLTSGSITGTVFDPSHAVVPNATVNLKVLIPARRRPPTTNASGSYTFGLVESRPLSGHRQAAGFAEVSQTLDVQVGQITKVDVELVVAKGTETVEVSGTAPLINTEPSQNTAFTQEEVAQLPSAGGDITNIADTAPGRLSTAPAATATSPSTACRPRRTCLRSTARTTWTRTSTSITRARRTSRWARTKSAKPRLSRNPYGGQYGQLAGAQVTYVTKSGTNQFHGNAMYWWNGRLLNANNWINKETQEFVHNNIDPTQPANQAPFSNANQWATSFGGPIIKNKTFFFVDFEGMRFLLPNVDNITAPSTAVYYCRRGRGGGGEPGRKHHLQQADELLADCSWVLRRSSNPGFSGRLLHIDAARF